MKVVKRKQRQNTDVLEHRGASLPGITHVSEECGCGTWNQVSPGAILACPTCGYRQIRCSACGSRMVETEDGHGCVPCDREVTA